jgi:hypothetical protein
MDRRRKDEKHFAVNDNKHYKNLTLFHFLSKCNFHMLYVLTLPYLKKKLWLFLYYGFSSILITVLYLP